MAGKTAVLEIGLDLHRFRLHSMARSGFLDHTADAKDYALMSIGMIPSDEVNSFRNRFDGIFIKASSRTSEDRTAAGGQQGHQRTPAFIHALLCQAKECKCLRLQHCACMKKVPKGGFTDVGLHTGGIKRNTSWPLVLSIFQWAFSQGTTLHVQGDVQFEKIMTYFHVKVMENYMDESGINGGAVAVGRGSKVDTAFWILRHAAFQAAFLADNGHDMTLICERTEMARSSMEQTASKFDNMKSEQFMLTNLSKSKFCAPQVILPDYVEPLKSALSTTELR